LIYLTIKIIDIYTYHCGGIVGGFGSWTEILGALRLGNGPVGDTNVGWFEGNVGNWTPVFTPDWEGIVPALVIAVAFPGPVTSSFLVWINITILFVLEALLLLKK
jgi:hypothetical protein